MKLNKVFLMGAIALGLVACNKSTPDIEPKAEGNTFASVQISAKSATTRAVEQKDHAGTAAENNLVELKMLSTVTPTTTWNYSDTEAANAFWLKTAGGNEYKTAPVKASAGTQTLAFIINPLATDKIGYAAQTKTYEFAGNVTELSTDNKFVMTSKGFEKTIIDNITEDVNKISETEDKNVFKDIDVERVVVKGIVRTIDGFENVVKHGATEVAEISDLKFVAVNGATKTFLYRDNAGERLINFTVDDPTTNKKKGTYTGFTSAIHKVKALETGKPGDAATAGLFRPGNYVKDDKTYEDGYDHLILAKPISEFKTDLDAANAFYFMENSGELSDEDKKEGFYRFAYAKVYATYKPKELLHLNEDKKLEIVKINPNTDGTFYKGLTDGLLYTSRDAAKASVLAKDQKSYTYTKGKAGYRALWNKQIDADGKTVLNADARRNSIYVLDIKDIAGLGFPWDPSDPNDPNLPHPGGDDPDPVPGKGPDDPNIEATETYMRVEARILPWNLVTRDAISLK